MEGVLLKIDSEASPIRYLFASLEDWEHRFEKTRSQIKVEASGYLNNGSCYKVVGPSTGDELRLVMLPDAEPSPAKIRMEPGHNFGSEECR